MKVIFSAVKQVVENILLINLLKVKILVTK